MTWTTPAVRVFSCARSNNGGANVGLIHPIIPTPRVRRWMISVWHKMVSCVICHKAPSVFVGKDLVWSSPALLYSRLTSPILLRTPNRKGPEASNVIVVILDQSFSTSHSRPVILDQGSSPAGIALGDRDWGSTGGALTVFYHISFTWVNHQLSWDRTLPAGSCLVVKHIFVASAS
jgi:hypothetical protein